jgi:hypothetical protein
VERKPNVSELKYINYLNTLSPKMMGINRGMTYFYENQDDFQKYFAKWQAEYIDKPKPTFTEIKDAT